MPPPPDARTPAGEERVPSTSRSATPMAAWPFTISGYTCADEAMARPGAGNMSGRRPSPPSVCTGSATRRAGHLAREHVVVGREAGEHRAHVAHVGLLAPRWVERSSSGLSGFTYLGAYTRCPPTALGIDHVRRLDHRGERHAPVGDVERVPGAEAAPAGASPGTRCRGSGSGPGRPPRPGRGPAAAPWPWAAAWRSPGRAARSRACSGCRPRGRSSTRSPCTGRVAEHAAAEPLDRLAERVHERLVAAVERAHHLLRGLVARPATSGASATTGRWPGGRRSGRRTSSRAAAARAPPRCAARRGARASPRSATSSSCS